MSSKDDLIKMNLEGIRMEFPSQKPIILLKEETGNRFLPIWIGAFEAYAIALELAHYKTPRPMTHDLIVSIIQSLNAHIDRVVITDLKNNTFYAAIRLVSDGKEMIVDSRPSDAIAIAIRQKSPIFVSKALTDKMIDEVDEIFETLKGWERSKRNTYLKTILEKGNEEIFQKLKEKIGDELYEHLLNSVQYEKQYSLGMIRMLANFRHSETCEAILGVLKDMNSDNEDFEAVLALFASLSTFWLMSVA